MPVWELGRVLGSDVYAKRSLKVQTPISKFRSTAEEAERCGSVVAAVVVGELRLVYL